MFQVQFCKFKGVCSLQLELLLGFRTAIFVDKLAMLLGSNNMLLFTSVH